MIVRSLFGLVGIAAATAVILASTTASAVDRPIEGVRLRLARAPGGNETLVFTSRDASLLFPTPESADDPVSGTPGGVLVELFSASTPGGVAFAAARDDGAPGWRRGPGRYVFRHTGAPDAASSLKSVRIRSSGVLRITGKSAGLPLTGAELGVGIRITTGSIRHCARFGPATVVREKPGLFLARSADTAELSDCSDASLLPVPPSPTPTPTPAPVCGDGVIHPEGELCDGAALGVCGELGLACGAPGYPNECSCCSEWGFNVSLGGCCNPSAIEVLMPPDSGYCAPLRCDPPFTCGALAECLPDGQCCGLPRNLCGIWLPGQDPIALQPCCAGSVCGRWDQQFFFYCCGSAGTACDENQDCCSLSCVDGQCS